MEKIKSFNILRITSVSIMPKFNGTSHSIFGELNASLQFTDKGTREVPFEIEIKSQASGVIEKEVFRTIIEDLINGRFQRIRQNISHKPSMYDVLNDRIDHIDYQDIPEPLNTVFRDLFDNDKWEFEKIKLTM